MIAENSVVGALGGGGVWVNGPALNVVGAVIRDNRDLIVDTTPPGSGGGIENSGAGAVTILGSIIEDNASAANGGGYSDTGGASLTIRNSFVLDNTAGMLGGGLATGGSLVTLTNTTVSSNTSLSGGDTTAGGGGLYITGTGTTRLTDSTIDGNTAAFGGGGIYDDRAAKLIITGSTVAVNRASRRRRRARRVPDQWRRLDQQQHFPRKLDRRRWRRLLGPGGTQEVTASRFTGNAASAAGAADLLGKDLDQQQHLRREPLRLRRGAELVAANGLRRMCSPTTRSPRTYRPRPPRASISTP